MNKVTKLVGTLVLGVTLSVAAALATVYDQVYSGSYADPWSGYNSDGYRYSSGSVTAPAGAEVNWEVGVSVWMSGYASASVSYSGVLSGGNSLSTGYGSYGDSGYDFVPSGGGDISWSISANSTAYYGSYGQASASAYMVVGW